MDWVKTEWVVPRMGGYFIPEREGGNELPEAALDRRRVARYWRLMHLELACRTKRRKKAYPAQTAPGHVHDSAQRWRYGQKIEVKVLESVMDLFHRLLAPGEKVCAIPCSHAKRGIAPEVVKRYLDSLDARLQIIKDRLHSIPPYGQHHEDLLDEQGSIRRWRRTLVSIQAVPNRRKLGLLPPRRRPPAG